MKMQNKHYIVGTMSALISIGMLSAAMAAPARKTLNADEIRQAFVGKVITDGFHWRYHLKPDGTVDADEMGRSRQGRWHLKGNQLCIAITAGSAPDECWVVVREGKALIFRQHGQDVVDVTIEKPGS